MEKVPSTVRVLDTADIFMVETAVARVEIEPIHTLDVSLDYSQTTRIMSGSFSPEKF